MGVLNALINGNNIDDLQEAFKEPDTTSATMQRNIDQCYNLFYACDGGKSEYTDLWDECQRIPVVIIDKLVKAVFSEYKTFSGKDDIDRLLKKIDKIKKSALQSVLLGGESFIKPVIKKNDIDFQIVDRNCFIPLGRDADGTINKVGMTETTVVGKNYYTLVETRTAGEVLTVEYKLYRSETKGSLGRLVDLDAIDKYADLEPFITIPVRGLGMAQIKTPCLNTVDGSKDGVCVFAPAVQLIKNINKNEKQLDDEFDLSQKRIIVSADMFKKNKNGKRILVDKVFTAIEDLDNEVGIHEFSPAIREQSYLNRKNEYLRNIETVCGFKRGILSDVEAVERTATEITSSEGGYNLSIIDLQEMWKEGIKTLISITEELARAYDLTLGDINPDDIVFDFGDGVLYNRDKTFNELMALVSAGVIDATYLIGWYFEIDITTPEGKKKAEEMMPAMDRLLEA